jgi:RNA polymerase subunit RPABC4/transcription elongation factor Spt4
MLASSLLLYSGASAGSTTLAAPHAAQLEARSHPAFGVPRGDIIVNAANSPYVLSPLTVGSTAFEQQGNITVQPGGRLYVDNLTVAFLQYIGMSGSIGVRANHLYNFTDEGLVVFTNSTLTTETGVLDAFVKLSVNVTDGGTLALQSSTFAYPGYITVNGASSRFYANVSLLTSNPSVSALVENNTLLADTSFSPSLVVTDGAHAVVTQSVWDDYYADNLTLNGRPGVNLTSAQGGTISVGESYTWSALSFPSSEPVSEAIADALGYTQYTSGQVTFYYQASESASFGTVSGIIWNGTTYEFPSAFTIPASPANTTISFVEPVPQSFIDAVNNQGVLQLLQNTGEFGGASALSTEITMSSGASDVVLLGMQLQLTPTFPFSMVVSNGAQITIADSTIGLNWNAVPGTKVDRGVSYPYPWASNKLELFNGSSAFLANVSTPTGYTTVFDNASIVIPEDNASAAYIYRWGQVEALSGAYGPIPNVHVNFFPAYPASNPDNATVSALNSLSTADPDLANYTNALAASEGITYGQTADNGIAQELLISSEVTATTLPTGTFLGTYHIGSVLPGGGANSTGWRYGTLSAYPLNMSPAGPDLLPHALYPNYRAELSFGAVSLAVANVSSGPGKLATGLSPEVALGQQVSFNLSVTNVGSAALFNFTVSFGLREGSGNITLIPRTQKFDALAAGAAENVTFSWIVNTSATDGVALRTEHSYAGSFVFNATWNGGKAPTGGSTLAVYAVTIVPAYITVVFDLPLGDLSAGPTYNATGSVTFYGTGESLVNVTANGTNGPFLIAQGEFTSGALLLPFVLPPQVAPGTQYTIIVSAYYDGRTVYDNGTGGITIAGSPAASPSFLDQLLGPLPLWLWLVIIVVAVAAALGALLLLSRRAQGKLVECGECGSLIPETATTCPKCGAEFESDLVRCSRCASTIPANSAVCPDCSAQLLGGADPKDPERLGYADFVERYRAEAKKELEENYNEGAFWDWWKRQPSYVPFAKWKSQQSSGSRAGMTAPVVGESAESSVGADGVPPPRTKGGGAASAAKGAAPPATDPLAPAAPPPPGTDAGAGSSVKVCSNCGKEIPKEFLVCPFCSAVTR